ncbi:hypothetical protein QR680_015339 [Steinernema hermaphroditum]|uniref:Peptidase A1 domain-containing protein n=1 Tax=Steinernema hermaphroditum TaxID=289476 RepID=A0AA39H8D4_9BILA|nr:hypothetical protein QR680_015339 [Steinernema hermaphroditum]
METESDFFQFVATSRIMITISTSCRGWSCWCFLRLGPHVDLHPHTKFKNCQHARNPKLVLTGTRTRYYKRTSVSYRSYNNGQQFDRIVNGLPPPNSLKANIRRHLPERYGSRAQNHFHHDPKDFNVLDIVVKVGTPPQYGAAVVDTTSGDIEITLCPVGAGKPTYPCFNSSQSSSFVQKTSNTASDSFWEDEDLGFVVPNVTFISRDHKTQFFGRVGLGWPSLRKYPGDTFFPDTSYDKWTRETFSISTGLLGCEAQIDFDATCEPNKKTIYLPATSRAYWQFAIKQVHLGSVKLPINGQAVIATNKEYIGMPKKFLDQLTSLHGITWEADYGAYTVDCNQKLPNLDFVTDGGVITIRPKQYVYVWEPLSNGRCVVNFEDSKAFGFGPEWYFGIQIVADYCVAFDFKKAQITLTENFQECDVCDCHKKQ